MRASQVFCLCALTRPIRLVSIINTRRMNPAITLHTAIFALASLHCDIRSRGCMKANRWVAGTLLVAMLSGCATSRNSFYADPVAVGNAEICRTLAGQEASTDIEFQAALRSELRLRGVDESACAAIVNEQNVAIGVGAVLGAVIVAAAASSGDSHHHHGRHHGRRHHSSETHIDIGINLPPAPAAPVEQADWDEYHSAAGRLVWGCRGVHTRQLVDPARCSGQEMNDLRWPSKTY